MTMAVMERADAKVYDQAREGPAPYRTERDGIGESAGTQMLERGRSGMTTGGAAAAGVSRSSTLERYQRLMRERFGFWEFRSGQAEVLRHLPQYDVLAVMPTGSGKSLCYVLPALAAGRVLVVSPLIALMQDQVQSLSASGVKAAAIHSNLDPIEQNRRYVDFVQGRLQLLYVAPERLANDKFVDGLRRAGLNLLAIDEAHCVSEWGHDFRPDYLMLGSVRKRLGSPRTLAMTATADPRGASKMSRRNSPARGCRRSPTTPGCRERSASGRRKPSCSTRRRSSWQPSPSGWGSTSRTFASSCTSTCRGASRPTTSRRVAPVAMANLRTACSCLALEMPTPTNGSSTARIRTKASCARHGSAGCARGRSAERVPFTLRQAQGER
ncbi:MAG: DEAD/DEAH box helicase, partial [Chloroflexi bacterium]|nr:DEAD/DEAH box helicase [Chloroflexota bacterium]